MFNFDVAPFLFEVLSHKAAVAMMGLLFAAQKAPPVQDVAADRFLDSAGAHQIEKLPLVEGPVAVLLLFVGIENFCRGCEIGQMHIVNATDRFGEIFEIVPFREPRELRNIVEAYIDETANA